MGEEIKEPTKEELQAALQEQGSEENDEGGEQEFTEVEQEAMTKGWKPEGVEGKRVLTAEEFLDRQPLYDEIHSLKRQTRRLQEGMEALQQHQKNIRKQEREQTIKELKKAKVTALEENDHERVVEIDDQIQDVKASEVNESPPTNTAFEDWVEGNGWYTQNPEMKQQADIFGAGYAQLNPQASLAEVYEKVTEHIKVQFADHFAGGRDHFAGGRRGKPTAVESAGTGRKNGGKAPKYSAKDLPEEHRQLMKTLIRDTGMTEQDYLKEYFKYETAS